MRILITTLSAGVLLLAAYLFLRPELDTVVTGVAYVGATVSDLEQTKTLYMQSTDLEEVQALSSTHSKAIDALLEREQVTMSSKMLRGVNAQIRYMQFDNVSEQAHQTDAVPVHGPGIAHICFQVDGETKSYDRFLQHGAQPIGATEMQQINPKRPVEYAYVKDHDGIVFEVEHVDVSKLELDTTPKNKYRIRHVSLSTPDIKRISKFYAAFLGQRSPRRIGRFGGVGNERMSLVSGLEDTKVKMTWFQLRNLELEIVQYTSHPTELPTTPRPLDALGYNMIVFDVSDLVQAQQSFIAAGGEIVSQIHSLDGGQIIFGRDPDKNLIGLQVIDSAALVSSNQFENNGI